MAQKLPTGISHVTSLLRAGSWGECHFIGSHRPPGSPAPPPSYKEGNVQSSLFVTTGIDATLDTVTKKNTLSLFLFFRAPNWEEDKAVASLPSFGEYLECISTPVLIQTHVSTPVFQLKGKTTNREVKGWEIGRKRDM